MLNCVASIKQITNFTKLDENKAKTLEELLNPSNP